MGIPSTPSRPPLTVHGRLPATATAPTTPTSQRPAGRSSDTSPHTPVGRHVSLPLDADDDWIYHPPTGLPLDSPATAMERAGEDNGSIDTSNIVKMMERGVRVMRWRPVTDSRHDSTVVVASAPGPVKLFYHRAELSPLGVELSTTNSAGALYWNNWRDDRACKQLQSKHCVKLSEVAEIGLGKESQVFRCDSAAHLNDQHCCTIITEHLAVDIEFEDTAQCCAWLFGLCHLIQSGLNKKPVSEEGTKLPLPAPTYTHTRINALAVTGQRLTRRYSLVPNGVTRGEFCHQRSVSTERLAPLLAPKLSQIRRAHAAVRAEASDQIAKMKREMEETHARVCVLLKQESARFRGLAQALNEERTKRIAAANRVIELQGNIRVFCRVRPLKADSGLPTTAAVSVLSEQSLAVTGHSKPFHFDRVFDPTSSQRAVYEEIAPFVQSAIDGFAVCVFAYGQTGAGKTWTMQGNQQEPGVSLRAIQDLFALTQAHHHLQSNFAPHRRSHAIAMEVDDSTASANTVPNQWFYSVSLSAVEIYNETLADLLADQRSKGAAKGLDIKHGPDGVYVPDLTELVVRSPEHVSQLIRERVELNRHTAATAMNERSSRSHSLILVKVAGYNPHTGDTSCGRLLLIDLAGSERLDKSLVSGQGAKEAAAINGSLSALGTCLAALQSKASHIPYRNSKLTHLLSDCLGGSAKAVMLCQIAPEESSSAESLCSLHFASRARSVELGAAKRLLSSAQHQHAHDENKKLKQQMKADRATLLESRQRHADSEELIARLRAQIVLLTEANTAAATSSVIGVPVSASPLATGSATASPIVIKSAARKVPRSVAFDGSTRYRVFGEDSAHDVRDENRPLITSPNVLHAAERDTKAKKRKEVDEQPACASAATIAAFSSSLASLVRGTTPGSAGPVMRERRARGLPPQSTLPSSILRHTAPNNAALRVKKLKATAAPVDFAPVASPARAGTNSEEPGMTAAELARRRLQERKNRVAAQTSVALASQATPAR